MDSTSVKKVSLDDFICEMMRIPSRELTLETLKDLFGKIQLKDELIDQHIRFIDQHYTRNLVCRTPRFDMLVLCWKPGQVTTIHDHLNSLNATIVYGGTMTNRMFEIQDKKDDKHAIVKKTREDNLSKGILSCVDRTEIHQMINLSDKNVVTVHIYAEPLRDITVYCPSTNEVDTVTLRYTLEDDIAV